MRASWHVGALWIPERGSGERHLRLNLEIEFEVEFDPAGCLGSVMGARSNA